MHVEKGTTPSKPWQVLSTSTELRFFTRSFWSCRRTEQPDVVRARVRLPGYWVALSRKGDAVWWLVSLRRGVDFLGTNVASRRLRSTTGRRERQLATASVATAEAPRLRAEAEETRQAHEAEAAAQKRTAGAAKNADEEATRIFVAGAGTEEQQRFMPEHHRGLPRDRTCEMSSERPFAWRT